MKRTFPNPRDTRGMSLVEVVLFIVMLAIVAFPLTKLARANLISLGNYATIEKAQYDIQSLMEQCIADFGALGYDACKTKWNGKYGSTNSNQFNYRVTIGADQTANGITYALVTVTVSGGGLTTAMSLKTWISKQ